MKYRINTKTNKIIEDNGNLGTFFYSEDWKEATQTEINNYNKEKLKKELIDSRLAYLNSTDWYIIREIDQPNSYPKEIKAARIRAREEINEIEACTTLKQLEKYDSK